MFSTNLFFLIYAAPSLTEDVQVVSKTATSVVLTWRPPFYINGSNLRYIINLKSKNMYKLNTSKQPNITLTGLTPYTFYTVTIRAYIDIKINAKIKIDINNNNFTILQSNKITSTFTTNQASIKAFCVWSRETVMIT